MNPVSALRFATLASLTLPGIAFAQGRFDTSSIPMEFLQTSPWTVSAGARYATEGASVNFGQLGNVRDRDFEMPEFSSDKPLNRTYQNGGVGADSVRVNERDAAGNPISTPGGRYAGRVVDAAGNESFVGDYLAYTPNRTRNWGFNSDNQISDAGTLGLSGYEVQSSGATAMSEKSASGGVEVAVNRRLRRFGRKAELGVGALFALNDINAGTSGSIQADLVSVTDFYRIYGNAPEAPYTGPSFTDLKNDAGTVILVGGKETTVAIDQNPFERQLQTIPNGATVLGSWKINGAYYVVRVGPTLRVFITDRLAFSFEAGLAAAFVGTAFEVRESFEVPDVTNPISTFESDDKTDVLAGFYGTGTAEYWMTDRTNAYLGAAYESLGSYQQSVNGRSAEIDIGSTVTVRFGLTTRF